MKRKMRVVSWIIAAAVMLMSLPANAADFEVRVGGGSDSDINAVSFETGEACSYTVNFMNNGDSIAYDVHINNILDCDINLKLTAVAYNRNGELVRINYSDNIIHAQEMSTYSGVISILPEEVGTIKFFITDGCDRMLADALVWNADGTMDGANFEGSGCIAATDGEAYTGYLNAAYSAESRSINVNGTLTTADSNAVIIKITSGSSDEIVYYDCCDVTDGQFCCDIAVPDRWEDGNYTVEVCGSVCDVSVTSSVVIHEFLEAVNRCSSPEEMRSCIIDYGSRVGVDTERFLMLSEEAQLNVAGKLTGCDFSEFAEFLDLYNERCFLGALNTCTSSEEMRSYIVTYSSDNGIDLSWFDKLSEGLQEIVLQKLVGCYFDSKDNFQRQLNERCFLEMVSKCETRAEMRSYIMAYGPEFGIEMYRFEQLNDSAQQQVLYNLMMYSFDSVDEFQNRFYSLCESAKNSSSSSGSGGGGSSSGGGSSEQVRVYVSDVRTRPGQTVTVDLSLDNNTGFSNIGFEIGYDSGIMTLVSVAENEDVGATYVSSQSYDANPYNVMWFSNTDNTYNGRLATLTFELNEVVSDGDYEISVNYYTGRDGNYTDGTDVNYDADGEPICFAYINGYVSVFNYTPGDINGDGVINNHDGTALLRYLAGWELSVSEAALDVDGSGTVNNHDGTALLRYLAGWEVELH